MRINFCITRLGKLFWSKGHFFIANLAFYSFACFSYKYDVTNSIVTNNFLDGFGHTIVLLRLDLNRNQICLGQLHQGDVKTISLGKKWENLYKQTKKGHRNSTLYHYLNSLTVEILYVLWLHTTTTLSTIL